MKRTNIHIFAAIALLFALAACTQDEAGFLPEGAEGTSVQASFQFRVFFVAANKFIHTFMF